MVSDYVGIASLIQSFAGTFGAALAAVFGVGLGFVLVWKIWKAIRIAIGGHEFDRVNLEEDFREQEQKERDYE
jgi:hypothetical protein